MACLAYYAQMPEESKASVVLFCVEVQGTPKPQGSKTLMPVGKKCQVCGRAPMRAVESSDKALKAWRKSIVVAARAQMRRDGRRKPISDPVKLSVEFRFQRPQSHLTKSGELRKGKPDKYQSAPDLSKLVRAVEDALTDAGVWDDDRLAVEYVSISKKYGVPGASISILS